MHTRVLVLLFSTLLAQGIAIPGAGGDRRQGNDIPTLLVCDPNITSQVMASMVMGEDSSLNVRWLTVALSTILDPLGNMPMLLTPNTLAVSTKLLSVMVMGEESLPNLQWLIAALSTVPDPLGNIRMLLTRNISDLSTKLLPGMVRSIMRDVRCTSATINVNHITVGNTLARVRV
jgi:hypothetical protein